VSFLDRLNRPILGERRRLPSTRARVIITIIALIVIGGGLLVFLAPPPLCRGAAPISDHSPEGAYHVYFTGGDVEEQMARVRERYGVETVIGTRSEVRTSVVATRRQITRIRCDAEVQRVEAL
jgi:hypothetical protein